MGVSDGMHPTRARLIEVTVDLLEQASVDEVTSARVLEASGISKGSMYHFFADFDDLLEHAYLRRFAAGVEASSAAIREIMREATSAEDFFERMHEVTVATQARARASLRFDRARMLAMAERHDRFRALLGPVQQQLTDALTELFARAQERGWVNRDFQPRSGAVFIQAYTLGRIVDDVTERQMDDEDWVNLIALIVRRGFAANPSP